MRINGCGLLVCFTNGKEIKCGETMFGKKRYCINCMQNINKDHEESRGILNEEFDAYYLLKEDKWLEDKCDNLECDFCKDRPDKPSLCDAQNG